MPYKNADKNIANDLINEQELATRWRVSRAFLRKQRSAGSGPKYFKLGAAVRYSLADVDAWLQAQGVAA